MNISNLRDNYPKLLTHMKENGYGWDHIDRVKHQIRALLSKTELNSIDTYPDVYKYYCEHSDSKTGLEQRLTMLGIIERFDLRGEFPDGRTWQSIKPHGNYRYLSTEFKCIIDTYREFETTRGVMKETSIHGQANNAASFLYELQCAGVSTPEDITQQAVINVFLKADGTLRRSYSYKKAIAAVLKRNVSRNPKLFEKLIAYLPSLKKTRKNIQYLTDEEVLAVKQVLSAPNSGLSLRDKAIGALVLCYGLRRCDIAKLKIDEVDLEHDKIRLCQQKTYTPLELPLTTLAGNAIYDYAVNERISNGCKFVFLAVNKPYGRLTTGTIGDIAAKIMEDAGIRQNDGDRKGTHIFRHRLATDLLGKDVPQPVISRIIGHAAPSSLETYLSSDFIHLKECALSIEKFPISQEVFVNA